jgi:hypothetical protein
MIVQQCNISYKGWDMALERIFVTFHADKDCRVSRKSSKFRRNREYARRRTKKKVELIYHRQYNYFKQMK